MNPPSVDIKDILEAESALALTFATDLFIGQEPGEPDDCVTIFDIFGFPPQLTFAKGEDYYRPSVQIRVRNNDYLTGWNLINDIKITLHARGPETWGGALYTLIACAGEPAMLDWDDNNRVRFVMSIDCQRR